MSRNPIEELGEFFDNTVRNRIKANEHPVLELGTINGNMALQVDSLSNAIPKGEYMVALRLTIGTISLSTTAVGLTTEEASGPESHSHTIDSHGHKVTLPGQLRALSAGDRVLVAWAGNEPVIIDIVISS
ncbi:MAG: hypothetical protein IKW37_01545 [Bacteroidaceae bacterium]|nr:hypothetical protein [Bacteroidaceae bacterium]